jgi:hypothetical protein
VQELHLHHEDSPALLAALHVDNRELCPLHGRDLVARQAGDDDRLGSVKRRRATLLLALGLGGCAPYLQGSAGYASGVSERADRQRGAAVDLHAGVDIVEGKNNLAFATGIHIRSRFTERVQQVAFGHEGMLRYFLHRHSPEPRWLPCPNMPAPSGCRVADSPPFLTPMELYLRAGASAITVGAQDGRATSGLTQFIEYGLVMMLGTEDVPYFTLGAAFDNDVRFNGRPGPVTLSFLVGVGYFKSKEPGSSGGGLFLGH